MTVRQLLLYRKLERIKKGQIKSLHKRGRLIAIIFITFLSIASSQMFLKTSLRFNAGSRIIENNLRLFFSYF